MTDGGGWTVIQKLVMHRILLRNITFICRRTDGSLVFWNQLWTAYKNGFNNGLQRNHWLGLNKIHALSTKDAHVTLRTDMWGNRCNNGGGGCTNPPLYPNGYWFDERGFYVSNNLIFLKKKSMYENNLLLCNRNSIDTFY